MEWLNPIMRLRKFRSAQSVAEPYILITERMIEGMESQLHVMIVELA